MKNIIILILTIVIIALAYFLLQSKPNPIQKSNTSDYIITPNFNKEVDARTANTIVVGFRETHKWFDSSVICYDTTEIINYIRSKFKGIIKQEITAHTANENKQWQVGFYPCIVYNEQKKKFNLDFLILPTLVKKASDGSFKIDDYFDATTKQNLYLGRTISAYDFGNRHP